MRNCDDCIHKAVCYRYSYGLPENYADKCGDYESSRCKGRWIEETKRECVFSIKDEDYECGEYGNVIYLHCSNCGWKTGSQANDFNYCPSCGAKMVEPQESEGDACKDCYYNDGKVHAECVVCEKAESEDKK